MGPVSTQGSSSVPISEWRLRIWYDPWQRPRLSSGRRQVQAYFPASEVQACFSAYVLNYILTKLIGESGSLCGGMKFPR